MWRLPPVAMALILPVHGQQHLFFNIPQGHGAVGIDNILEGPSFAELDQNIRIDKIPGSHLRKNYAYRAFSRSRHADEYNIRFLFYHWPTGGARRLDVCCPLIVKVVEK